MHTKEELLTILEEFFTRKHVSNYFYKNVLKNPHRITLDGYYNLDELADEILALRK